MQWPRDDNNNNWKECLSNYILILNPQNYNNCFEKCEFYYILIHQVVIVQKIINAPKSKVN